MIIVSQSKRLIINFNNILGLGLSSLEDKSVAIKIYELNNSKGSTIARYETEKRAKEVLQEIVKKYSSYLELKGGPAIVQGQIDIQPNMFNIPKVYEMPKE